MKAALQAFLALIEAVLPLLGSGGQAALIEKIIMALETWLPIIASEIESLYPIVMNIIAGLRGNGAVTPDQLTRLDTMEQQIDAGYEAAAARIPGLRDQTA